MLCQRKPVLSRELFLNHDAESLNTSCSQRPFQGAQWWGGRSCGLLNSLGNRHQRGVVYTGSVSDVTRILDRVQQGEAKPPMSYCRLFTTNSAGWRAQDGGRVSRPNSPTHRAGA